MTTERPADDMDALLAWLKEQALEAHNKAEKYADRNNWDFTLTYSSMSLTYNRVIAKIENSRINPRPHVPQGWDEV